MTFIGWLQIALVLGAVLVCAWPLGLYMARSSRASGRPLAGAGPCRTRVLRLAGIDPTRSRPGSAIRWRCWPSTPPASWSSTGCCGCRACLPLNPQGFAGVAPDLAFNTAVSFVTNTNWQSYGGETTMSHLVQMAGLTVQNFLSAATGIALAIAVTRAFARSRRRRSAISGSI